MTAPSKLLGFLWATLAMAYMAVPVPALAHADINVRIAGINARIAATPDDPQLYLQRGELHRAHREWSAALDDYQHAARLAPGLPEVDYYTGRMWLEAGRPDLARPGLDRFLAVRPGHADALLTRSRALAKLGEGRAAVVDLTRAIAFLDPPAPEHYLERAQVLVGMSADHVDEALRGIDKGIATLGPLVTLVQFAVEVEAGRRHHDAALARVASLPRALSATPMWLARRADILLAAGRAAEARTAYGNALAAIKALPLARRSVPAISVLESRLHALLANQTGDG